MIARIACALLCLSVLACGGAGGQPAVKEKPAILRVGLVPNRSPDTVRAQYEPFRAYLEQRLGTKVEVFVATDYAGTVEALLNNRLDIAYLGGLTYVQARSRGAVHPMVTEVDRITHTTSYTSAIVTRTDSPVRTLADLRGRRFAFGDIGSTSGSLYPRIMLEEAGFKAGSDPKVAPQGLREVVYTGGHDATALAVQNGTVDAGGLEERILLNLEDAGTVDRARVRLVERSAPIEGYPWVIRDRIDPSVEQRIVDAFLGISDPTLLKLMRAERYGRVSDADYAYIRKEAKHFGLL